MIVCNTRELAIQNLNVVRKMAQMTDITSGSTAYDLDVGQKFNAQVQAWILLRVEYCYTSQNTTEGC